MKISSNSGFLSCKSNGFLYAVFYMFELGQNLTLENFQRSLLEAF